LKKTCQIIIVVDKNLDLLERE